MSTKKIETPEESQVDITITEIDETIECSICGKAGGPNVQCGLCHGNAATQSRAFTLSDVRTGRAPDDKRYGVGGSVEPTIITLPGSAR